MVLAAMVPLVLGMCGGLVLVVDKVTGSGSIAVIAATGVLLCTYGLWFGYMLYRRNIETR